MFRGKRFKTMVHYTRITWRISCMTLSVTKLRTTVSLTVYYYSLYGSPPCGREKTSRKSFTEHACSSSRADVIVYRIRELFRGSRTIPAVKLYNSNYLTAENKGILYVCVYTCVHIWVHACVYILYTVIWQ